MIKKTLFTALTAILLFSRAWPQEAKNVPYKTARNYFVNNTVKTGSPQTFTITDSAGFASIFGMAAHMGANGRPTDIDFAKEFVLAVAGKASATDIKLSALRLKQAGNKLVFTYQVKTGKSHPSYTSVPCLIILVNNKYQNDAVEFVAEKVSGE